MTIKEFLGSEPAPSVPTGAGKGGAAGLASGVPTASSAVISSKPKPTLVAVAAAADPPVVASKPAKPETAGGSLFFAPTWEAEQAAAKAKAEASRQADIRAKEVAAIAAESERLAARAVAKIAEKEKEKEKSAPKRTSFGGAATAAPATKKAAGDDEEVVFGAEPTRKPSVVPGAVTIRDDELTALGIDLSAERAAKDGQKKRQAVLFGGDDEPSTPPAAATAAVPVSQPARVNTATAATSAATRSTERAGVGMSGVYVPSGAAEQHDAHTLLEQVTKIDADLM